MPLPDWRQYTRSLKEWELRSILRSWAAGTATPEMTYVTDHGEIRNPWELLLEVDQAIAAAEDRFAEEPTDENEDAIIDLASVGYFAMGMVDPFGEENDDDEVEKVEGRRIVDRVSRGGYKCSVAKAKPNFSARRAEEQLFVSESDANKIVDRIVEGGSARDVLNDISELMDGLGVEAWYGEGMDTSGPLVSLYIDAGDLYTATVVYDAESSNYLLTDMGSYREDRIREGKDVAKSLPGGNVGGTLGVSPSSPHEVATDALSVENTREQRS